MKLKRRDLISCSSLRSAEFWLEHNKEPHFYSALTPKAPIMSAPAGTTVVVKAVAKAAITPAPGKNSCKGHGGCATVASTTVGAKTTARAWAVVKVETTAVPARIPARVTAAARFQFQAHTWNPRNTQGRRIGEAVPDPPREALLLRRDRARSRLVRELMCDAAKAKWQSAAAVHFIKMQADGESLEFS